jgi:hypothetical protein
VPDADNCKPAPPAACEPTIYTSRLNWLMGDPIVVVLSVPRLASQPLRESTPAVDYLMVSAALILAITALQCVAGRSP